MDKQLVAIAGAIIAGCISLVVAYINLRSSARLNKLSREYDLLKRDLDALDSIKRELNSITLPRMPDASELKAKPQEELSSYLQNVLDKLHEPFKKVSGILLREKSLFPTETQQELVEKYNYVVNTTGGGMVASRMEFIIWAQNTVDNQISNVRERWLNST